MNFDFSAKILTEEDRSSYQVALWAKSLGLAEKGPKQMRSIPAEHLKYLLDNHVQLVAGAPADCRLESYCRDKQGLPFATKLLQTKTKSGRINFGWLKLNWFLRELILAC